VNNLKDEPGRAEEETGERRGDFDVAALDAIALRAR